MRVVDAATVDSILTMPALVEAIDEAFRSDMQAPARLKAPFADGGGLHLAMPAWTADAPGAGAFIGCKVLNVVPANGARDLPSVVGSYLLFDGETGFPIAVIDGTRLTHWRTAATSALAARHLARPDARRLVVMGSGQLAPMFVHAHRAVRPIDDVVIWNHRPAGALRLAAALADQGIPARASTDIASEVARADIVSCVTLATAPILKGEWLRPGCHVDLVGGYSMTTREADDAALLRSRIFIDSEKAAVEGGDVAIAIAAGTIGRQTIVGDLKDLVRGRIPGRGAGDEITLFKSVGLAIEDLAAAILLWRSVAT